MLAVIRTGGKQYPVSVGDKIKIEKIEIEEGKQVVFDDILMLEDDKGKVDLGDPLVKGAKVKGKVVAQKQKKTTVMKYKSKKRYQKKKGYKQPYTEVEITDISKK